MPLDISSKVKIAIKDVPISGHIGTITDVEIDQGQLLFIVKYDVPFKVERKVFLDGGAFYEDELEEVDTLSKLYYDVVTLKHTGKDTQMYKVYVSNWWKHAPGSSWPNELEPDPSARKHTLAMVATEAEAQAIAREYNATHKPGKLSRKAEYCDS